MSFALTEGSGTVPSDVPVAAIRGAALRIAGNAAVEESESSSVALIKIDWGGLDESMDAEAFAVQATKLTVAVDAALSRARRVCRALSGSKWKRTVPDITKVSFGGNKGGRGARGRRKKRWEKNSTHRSLSPSSTNVHFVFEPL